MHSRACTYNAIHTVQQHPPEHRPPHPRHSKGTAKTLLHAPVSVITGSKHCLLQLLIYSLEGQMSGPMLTGCFRLQIKLCCNRKDLIAITCGCLHEESTFSQPSVDLKYLLKKQATSVEYDGHCSSTWDKVRYELLQRPKSCKNSPLSLV